MDPHSKVCNTKRIPGCQVLGADDRKQLVARFLIDATQPWKKNIEDLVIKHHDMCSKKSSTNSSTWAVPPLLSILSQLRIIFLPTVASSGSPFIMNKLFMTLGHIVHDL